MALFYINKPAHEGLLKDSLIVAHPTQPLIASAWTSPVSVLVTDNEGEVLTVLKEPAETRAGLSGSVAVKEPSVTTLAWHPVAKVLVIGWDNGKLSLWSMPDMSELGLGNEDGQSPAHLLPNSGRDGDGGTASVHAVVPMSTNAALLTLAAKAGTWGGVDGAVRAHNAGAVTTCTWTPHGTYLITGSRQKTVALWELEQTTLKRASNAHNVVNKLRCLWSTETEAAVTRAIFVSGNPANKPAAPIRPTMTDATGAEATAGMITSEDSQADAMHDEVAFLLLLEASSKVWYVTDEQRVLVCATQDEPITDALYSPARRTLVTLNRSFLIDVFRVSEDLIASAVFRRKLSLPSSGSGGDIGSSNGSPVAAEPRPSVSMAWATPCVVAFACGDDRVRLFDVESEVTFMVPFPQPGVHVTEVATAVSKGLLAMGTAEGMLAVCQCIAVPRSCAATPSPAAATSGATATNATAITSGLLRDRAHDWEALATHELGERIDRVVFGPLGDMAVSVGGNGLQVLHEAVRKRAWDGVAAATQISATMVVIESVTGCQCLLQSSSKIRGLSIAFPNIALWNGSQIDLYTVNDTTSEFTLTNFVPTTSPAFAIHREGLFYVKDTRIVFATLQLRPITQMTFTEAEGVPVILEAMNDYLVAVSSRNYLRLTHISPRELRPLGPSRPLHLLAGGDTAHNLTVISAKVNAQGRRVALMTTVGPLAAPDSRIWVYDFDMDKVSCFDFATLHQIPDAVYWNTPEPNANSIGELEYMLLACETHTVRAATTNTTSAAVATTSIAPPSKDATEAAEVGAGRSETPVTGPRSGRPVHHDEPTEAMPDMENFAEKKKQMEGGRRGSLGATNLLPDRAHNVVTLFATRDGLIVHSSVTLKRYQICLAGLTIPDFLLASVKINGNPSNPEDYVIEQKRLRDFDGLKSDKDVVVREALMKFSYYSTIGNMDEAYRCIKSIKNPVAWQGLARMCISSGRLDVAAVCLAMMQDGVAARALREAKEDYPDDKNVQLATLACSLNMIDECEQLLRASKRYDLITDLFLACGKFEQAQRHSERLDRIRIRPVAYKYAQFMESLQNLDAAVMWYYNAKGAGTDVPRVYYQSGRLQELQHLLLPAVGGPATGRGTAGTTVTSTRSEREGSPTPASPSRPLPNASASDATGQRGGSSPELERQATSSGTGGAPALEEPRSIFATLFPQNKELLLWWANYCERRRNVQEALRFYHASKSTFDVVRLLCGVTPPKIDNAVDLVTTEVEKTRARFEQKQALATVSLGRDVKPGVTMSGRDPTTPAEPEPVGAAFFIGLYYERSHDMERALRFYRYAGAYYSGNRVARKAQQDSVVVALAKASEDTRLMLDSALYLERKKAYDKAVELYRAIGAVQYALDVCIKGSLYETLHDISTHLASESTDPRVFLAMARHFERIGNFAKAVEMLVFARRYDEALQQCQEHNVTLTDDMAETITSEANTRDLSGEERTALLRRVAHIAKEQGSWNLACKKYTQTGERVKAMKMLMRGGDVDKVIFFANHSRNAEIYTLAGNFLQSHNWQEDEHIYKSIVNFYTKAKAYDSLAAFYDSCAQVQIDDHRNYPEALRVLQECQRTLDTAVAARAVVNVANVATLKERVAVLQNFVKAQQVLDTMNSAHKGTSEEKAKMEEVVGLCSDLIKRSRPTHVDHGLIEAALRIGDVFALLVKLYYEKMGEAKNALKVLESMPKHGVEIQYYVEMSLVEKICADCGKRLSDVVQRAGGDGENETDGRSTQAKAAAPMTRDEQAATIGTPNSVQRDVNGS